MLLCNFLCSDTKKIQHTMPGNENHKSLQLPSNIASMGSPSSSTFLILTAGVLNSSLNPHPDTARGSWTGQLFCSLLRKGSSINWKMQRETYVHMQNKATYRGGTVGLTLSLSRLRRISLVSSSVSRFSFLILMMGVGPMTGASDWAS